MSDMLVKLFELPDPASDTEALRAAGIVCRPAETSERSAVVAWTKAHFPNWVDEVIAGFAKTPANVIVAVENGAVLGFACYNVTRPNYFGPTGVDASRRGEGIGRALLLLALQALKAEGYAYAIIGGVGPAAFYEKAVGATLIPGSEAGIYAGRIAPGARP